MVSGELPNGAGHLPAGLAAGSRVAGYLLEEQIGSGGMAVVFRARDERLDRRVALKILAPAIAADAAFRQRFIRESRAAAAVDDPHVIPVFDAGEADGVLFIAMRYVPGGDVRTLVRREGPLPLGRAAAIISSTASALDAAHRAGLVHRDVKPANMLVDVQPGRPDHVYLSDFGLSKGAMSSVALTGVGQFLGTPGYTAPEQMQGKPVDGRADQYSLACAAFEMLCGQAPFPHEQIAAVMWAHMSEPPPPLTSRRSGLPPAVDGVLAKALAKAPEDRYASCLEFADALHGAFGLDPYTSGSGVIPQEDHARTDVPRPAAPAPADEGIRAAAAFAAAAGGGHAQQVISPGSPDEITLPPAVTRHDARPTRSGRPVPLAAPTPAAPAPPRRQPAPTSPAPAVPRRPPASPSSAPAPPPRPPPAEAGRDLLTSPGAGRASAPTHHLERGTHPGSGLTRRRLLVAGGAFSSVAVLAGIVWDISRPHAARGAGKPRSHSTKAAAPVRRTAIWQARVPFGQGAVMAVAGGVVSMAGGLEGPHGNVLHALRASDGARMWSFTTQISVIPSLAATARDVYVGVDPLYALGASDGATLWTGPFPPGFGPVVIRGSVYVGNGLLYAVRASDGAELWTYPADVTSDPVAAGGVLYVLGAKNGANGATLEVLHALRASDGTQLWTSPGPPGGSLATDGIVVCGVDGANLGPGGQLWAWRASDGAQLWSSDPNSGFGAPAMAAGVVYVVDVGGQLLALRASDGKTIWSHPANVKTTPVIANGVVYAGSSADELIALRASDGKLMWQFPTGFSIGPVVAGGTVYVSDGTTVYAVPA